MTIPWSTPKSMTPAVATRLTTNEDVRTSANRRSAPRSVERQSCRDDDRSQSGLGQVGEEPVEEEEQQDDEPRPDNTCQLGLGTGLVGHGRAGAADGHREALEEAGRDVRGADADHLLVRIHLVTSPGGEARRRGDGVRQRHQRDAHRTEQQWADVGQFRPRQRRHGNTLRERADGLHAVRGQVEHGGDNRDADDRNQNGGHPTGEPREDQQHGKGAESGHQRRPVGLVEPADEGPHLADEVVGTGREAEELGKLADDDGHGQTVHVADPDLAGEEVGDEAELGHPQPDLDQPDQYRHHAGERDGARRVVGDHQWCDGGEDERRDRRIRSEHQHLRRTEHGIGHEAGDRRVEAGHRRESGQLRVGHALGDQDRGEDHPGHQV